MRAGGAGIAGLLLAAAAQGCDTGEYQFDSDVPDEAPAGYAFIQEPDGGYDLAVSGLIVDTKTRSLAVSAVRRLALDGRGVLWNSDTKNGSFAALHVAWSPSARPADAGFLVSLNHGRSPGWTCRSADSGKVLWAGRSGSHWGTRIAGCGDVDGDGQSDILVADPFDAGTVYVLSGASGSTIRVHEGETPEYGLGAALLGAGDVDGDGKSEYLLSACDKSHGSNGSLRLVNGATGSNMWLVDGSTQRAYLGSSLCLTGDIDGDRHPDIVAVAGGDLNVVPFANGEIRTLSASTGKTLWSVVLPWKEGKWVMKVLAVPDADGDGLDDLLLAANVGNYQEERTTGLLLSARTGTQLGQWETSRPASPRLRGFGPVIPWKGATALAAASEESTIEKPIIVLLDPMKGTLIETLHPGR